MLLLKSKRHTYAIVLFLVVFLVALMCFLLASWLPSQPRQLSGDTASSADVHVVRDTPSSLVPEQVENRGKEPDTKTENTGARSLVYPSTRETYTNMDQAMDARFAALAERAVQGDTEALLYAQQQVSQCHATLAVAEHGFSYGEVSAYRKQLLAKRQDFCGSIAKNPNYHEIKAFSDTHANDSLVKGLADAIRQAFAQRGVEGALQVGLSGLKAQPSLAVEGVVSNTFASLGVSRFYAEALLHSANGAATGGGGSRRLMDAALALLACDYGMPCGPNSLLVISQCLAASHCVPGAGVRELSRRYLFSGQDWHDVMVLLAFLRQVPTTSVAFGQ